MTSRERADAKLERLLEDAAAGGPDFEGVGVRWVAIRALLGKFPAEVAGLLAGLPRWR